MDNQIYNVKEVANILKISTSLVRKLIDSKQLKGVKVGREYRVTEESINNFINKEDKENEWIRRKMERPIL